MNNEHMTPPEEGKLNRGKRGGNLTTGMILIAIGALFLLRNFELLDLGRYWPLLLIVIGVGLLLRRAS